MHILIINPPHPAIGSRIPHEHLPPLSLLFIGGALIDAGHRVELLDAEFGPMTLSEMEMDLPFQTVGISDTQYRLFGIERMREIKNALPVGNASFNARVTGTILSGNATQSQSICRRKNLSS